MPHCQVEWVRIWEVMLPETHVLMMKGRAGTKLKNKPVGRGRLVIIQ
jgi:hypothetical protein